MSLIFQIILKNVPELLIHRENGLFLAVYETAASLDRVSLYETKAARVRSVNNIPNASSCT